MKSSRVGFSLIAFLLCTAAMLVLPTWFLLSPHTAPDFLLVPAICGAIIWVYLLGRAALTLVRNALKA